MKTVSLTIDSQKIESPAGHPILWAALDHGIYIPNLCAVREAEEPFAACRLCFVDIEGYPEPVTACTEPVSEGMVVNTRHPQAQGMARTSLELLLASHPVDCAKCAANGRCELQRSAKHLGVKLKTKRFKKLLRDLPIDSSSPVFIYDPNKCVLCGKCVLKCREVGPGAIGFAHRGFERIVTSFGDQPIGQSKCNGCRECVAVCPVGALLEKKSN
ncbi:MAG: 2Fe-2S iron-sulfur cluster-binding protein [Dehalococcoidia bacterium]|nr:2Fe-2S iron-sulfur cluster-binding protein [Dehalococcoidia bacterium]